MKYFFYIFILTICSSSYGQKGAKTTEHYNCIRKFNLTLKERLQYYPFNVATKIMLVSFTETEENLFYKKDSIEISKFKETKTLSNEQIDSLTNLLYNIGVKGNVFKFTPAACFFPRNAILFLNSNEKVFEFIEICFECHRTATSSERINDGISCEQKFDLIRSYFRRQGIEYGVLDDSQ